MKNLVDFDYIIACIHFCCTGPQSTQFFELIFKNTKKTTLMSVEYGLYDNLAQRHLCRYHLVA